MLKPLLFYLVFLAPARPETSLNVQEVDLSQPSQSRHTKDAPSHLHADGDPWWKSTRYESHICLGHLSGAWYTFICSFHSMFPLKHAFIYIDR